MSTPKKYRVVEKPNGTITIEVQATRIIRRYVLLFFKREITWTEWVQADSNGFPVKQRTYNPQNSPKDVLGHPPISSLDKAYKMIDKWLNEQTKEPVYHYPNNNQ